MGSQSKPPAGGGGEITLEGDMDLDALVAEMEAKAPKPPAATPAAPAADDLEMVNLDEEPAPAESSAAGADSDVEMVEVSADDDVEMVEVDQEPAAPAPAPLPDWLGDDLPSKPLIEQAALAVDLSAPLPEPELDLRHEFQRETRPDPKYLFEETKELAKEDEGQTTHLICNKCGARNKIGVYVCRNCGDKLKIPQDIFEQYYEGQ